MPFPTTASGQRFGVFVSRLMGETSLDEETVTVVILAKDALTTVTFVFPL